MELMRDIQAAGALLGKHGYDLQGDSDFMEFYILKLLGAERSPRHDSVYDGKLPSGIRIEIKHANVWTQKTTRQHYRQFTWHRLRGYESAKVGKVDDLILLGWDAPILHIWAMPLKVMIRDRIDRTLPIEKTRPGSFYRCIIDPYYLGEDLAMLQAHYRIR